MLGADAPLLVRAARGEPVERPPVWAMRQAGRWDPEFNKLRAGHGFYEFSENVELAARGSLCPRRFGVDGIILFYDITTLPVAMGLPFELRPQLGPVPDRPIRSLADVDRLDPNPDPSRYRHIIELLRVVKRQLHGELPVLAFAGAPYTVAAYCIGTGKDTERTRRFAADQPAAWRALLDRLSGATVGFLNTLIREGADVYQLFDSWAGQLAPAEYDEWAQRFHREIFAGATGVPRILFVKEGPYMDRMVRSGAEVVSLGTRHDLAAARRDYPELVFQGNVDSNVLRSGAEEDVATAVQACLRAGGGHRHIVNLSHGVDKDTTPANFEAFVRSSTGGEVQGRHSRPPVSPPLGGLEMQS
jgi:uroporphyrinogen decarboxylase